MDASLPSCQAMFERETITGTGDFAMIGTEHEVDDLARRGELLERLVAGA